VQSSCDGHVTSSISQVPEAVGVYSDQGSDPICDVPQGDNGNGQVWSVLIGVACRAWQGRNGVNTGRIGQR